MSGRPEIDADLTLELDGKGLTPLVFRKSVAAFVGLLRAATRSVCQGTKSIDWQMQVKAGSNLIGAHAAEVADRDQANLVRTLAARCFESRRDAGADAQQAPDALRKHVRKLAALVGTGNIRISVWTGRQRHAIRPEPKAVQQAVPQQPIPLPGSVEGHLTSLHAGDGLHVEIREYIRRRPVQCAIPDELAETAKSLWRKRVIAHGLVHYNPRGEATRVQVDRIEALPDDSELPSYLDVFGILGKRSPTSSAGNRTARSLG